MSKRIIPVSVVLLLLLAAGLSAAGCGRNEPAQKETRQEVAEQKEEGPTKEAGGAHDASRTVTMNGRSVMGGWMESWGFSWEGPVEKNGYFFDYKELDASELGNMSGSFAGNVDGLPAGSVVFFKFCFADFSGDNLSTLEGIIDEVVNTAREKGLRLIIGNALPVRKQDSPDGVVTEYKKYNEFLQATAAANPDVWIYDFYGVLAGSDGYLKPEYDTGDSHPNGKGYAALDLTFFPFLEGVF